MRIIDGSLGEGGGQILRTSLALAAVTGQPFRIERIRAGRKKPGLLRQHLACVEAAVAVSGGVARGAELGSVTLEFTPGVVKPGRFSFSIGTAGSASLVLQTVLPPLVRASGPSEISVEGGTHNSMAPTADFLRVCFLPLVNRLGPRVHVNLERHGFYPAGGGRITLLIEPGPMTPFDLLTRGLITRTRAVAVVSNLSEAVAHRELRGVQSALGLGRDDSEVIQVKSPGPGNVLWIECVTDEVTEMFTSFGEKMVRAEEVAQRAIREAKEWIAADVPIGPHLADQWVLMLALAGGGSFRTGPPSDHLRTNVSVIRQFLSVAIQLEESSIGTWLVSVR
jgi:RNA 3'-terminal phosphate cyclase (ATP)